MTILYCVQCEEMFKAEETPLGMGHAHMSYAGDSMNPPEFDFCEFPDGWATCPPPEARPDWHLDEEFLI